MSSHFVQKIILTLCWRLALLLDFFNFFGNIFLRITIIQRNHNIDDMKRDKKNKEKTWLPDLLAGVPIQKRMIAIRYCHQYFPD